MGRVRILLPNFIDQKKVEVSRVHAAILSSARTCLWALVPSSAVGLVC